MFRARGRARLLNTDAGRAKKSLAAAIRVHCRDLGLTEPLLTAAGLTTSPRSPVDTGQNGVAHPSEVGYNCEQLRFY